MKLFHLVKQLGKLLVITRGKKGSIAIQKNEVD